MGGVASSGIMRCHKPGAKETYKGNTLIQCVAFTLARFE